MKRRIALACAALAALPLADPPSVAAQTTSLQRRLTAAKRISCSFSTLATGNWDGSTATAAVTPAKLDAAFFDINIDEGTAEAEGEFGASFISVRFSEGYLHFMQASDSGPLYVTTVFPRQTTDGKLLAVHTRHEYTPTAIVGFTSRPEMYVGSCTLG
jgi:hypothetical protein